MALYDKSMKVGLWLDKYILSILRMTTKLNYFCYSSHIEFNIAMRVLMEAVTWNSILKASRTDPYRKRSFSVFITQLGLLLKAVDLARFLGVFIYKNGTQTFVKKVGK